MQLQYHITSEVELREVVDTVIAMLRERENREKEDTGAVVLALHGELGAGKTTFLQLLGRVLGVTETITSPTFVIMKKYATTDVQFSQFVHIDAYRIESVDEMRPLQFEVELTEKGSIIGIEWAERIAELLPPDTLHIDITIEGETRVITMQHGKTD